MSIQLDIFKSTKLAWDDNVRKQLEGLRKSFDSSMQITFNLPPNTKPTAEISKIFARMEIEAKRVMDWLVNYVYAMYAEPTPENIKHQKTFVSELMQEFKSMYEVYIKDLAILKNKGWNADEIKKNLEMLKRIQDNMKKPEAQKELENKLEKASKDKEAIRRELTGYLSMLFMVPEK